MNQMLHKLHFVQENFQDLSGKKKYFLYIYQLCSELGPIRSVGSRPLNTNSTDFFVVCLWIILFLFFQQVESLLKT